MAVSGYVLMFPFYGTDIANMQSAQVFHGVVAMLFIAAMLGRPSGGLDMSQPEEAGEAAQLALETVGHDRRRVDGDGHPGRDTGGDL